MPIETKYTVDQIVQGSPTLSNISNVDNNHNDTCSRKHLSSISSSSYITSPINLPAGRLQVKRRTISLSSDDDVVELVLESECEKASKKKSTKPANFISRKRDETIEQV